MLPLALARADGHPVPRRVGERRWSHQGAASYDTVQIQRHPQTVAELVREIPPTRLMLLYMRDPRRYPLAQELNIDISADTLSCQELKATLVNKGPQIPVALYPNYGVICCAHIPTVCLAGTLQAAGVKVNPFHAQLDRSPVEWAPVSHSRIPGPFGPESRRQPDREGQQNLQLCSRELAYSYERTEIHAGAGLPASSAAGQSC